MGSVENDVLVIIVEAHQSAWNDLLYASESRKDGISPVQFISQVCAFINTYQLLNEASRLAVLASGSRSAPTLYSDLHLLADPESAGPSIPAAQVVATELKSLLEAESEALGAAELSGGRMSAAMSTALCMLSIACSQTTASNLARPRMLILQVSADVPSQYIACMNSIFSAQRLNVTIDAVCVAGHLSGFVQQAAHMTGGIYLQMKRPSALIQYLSTCFTASTHSRSFLELPKSKGIDFKATCFCHARVISIGYVCSVCLSVFCSPQRECSTCGTDFHSKRPSAPPA